MFRKCKCSNQEIYCGLILCIHLEIWSTSQTLNSPCTWIWSIGVMLTEVLWLPGVPYKAQNTVKFVCTTLWSALLTRPSPACHIGVKVKASPGVRMHCALWYLLPGYSLPFSEALPVSSRCLPLSPELWGPHPLCYVGSFLFLYVRASSRLQDPDPGSRSPWIDFPQNAYL